MTDTIDELIAREGGDRETNDPADSGGRTKFGISERSHPEAWADGDVDYEEARRIYTDIYITRPRFHLIPEHYLRQQMVDFSVTAGTKQAIQTLQRIVGASVDGVIGPDTLRRVAAYPGATVYGHRLPPSLALNLAYERARGAFYVRLAQARPKDLKWLYGWLARTLSWRSSREPAVPPTR